MLTLDALAKRTALAALFGLLLALVMPGLYAAIGGVAALYLLLLVRGGSERMPWQQ